MWIEIIWIAVGESRANSKESVIKLIKFNYKSKSLIELKENLEFRKNKRYKSHNFNMIQEIKEKTNDSLI